MQKWKNKQLRKIESDGVHQDGGMQEYLSVPVSHLIKVNELSLDEAAILEPLAIGAHSVRRGDVKRGERVLVIGAGPIGLGVMIFAKQKGADVIAMDVNEERLSFCKEWLGIENTVNALETPVEKLSDLTNGAMVDTVIDATGNKKSMENAFNYITHGGKLIYVGLVKQSIEFFDPDFHKRETILMGSRNVTLEDFETIKRVLENKKFSMTSYITHHSNFKEMIKAFPSWSNPESKVIKAMI